MPKSKSKVKAKYRVALKVGILAADFHPQLAEDMIAAAEDEVALMGAKVALTVRVPGCYETPLIAEQMLELRKVDALVVLGCIERGETKHGEVMGQVVHRALVETSLRHDKPVGLGIIGPGATAKQAEARKDASARAAVRAVVRSQEAMRDVKQSKAEH